MRTGNPTLKDSVFLDAGTGHVYAGSDDVMTLNGTVGKTALLLFLLLLTAGGTWFQLDLVNNPGGAMPYVLGGAIGGLVLALATVFRPVWASVTAPLYALFEGLFIGAISAIYEAQYPGIVVQAVMLTFGTLAALLMAYSSGMIKATENFKLGVVAATGGICLVYIATLVLALFGIQVPMIHESGTVGILFSLFVVVVAALNLVLDFDFIETGVNANAPKHMEWYGAFGLVVTLVWLYIEFLRLLAKLRR